jgi:AcrR family transcriptional regulator
MSNRKQTRQRLRDAAWAMFNQEGFSGASIQRITDLAGYSRGAFYSNYSSKIELLLELLKTDLDSMVQHLSSLDRANSQRVNTLAQLLEAIHRNRLKTERSLLWAEATVLAARNHHFRGQFAQIQNNRISAFSAYLNGPDRRTNQGCDLQALGLLSLYDGMNLLQAAGVENCLDDIAANTLFTALLPDCEFRSAIRLLRKEPR